jgi:23S rRNA-/tRNA-specific pseudouridylate synthase
MSTIDMLNPKDARHCVSSAKGAIAVVACGPGWVVVDKPCGLSIHNDPGGDLCSVMLNAMRSGRLAPVGRFFRSVHAVHRLDRDTSGLVLLAGDPGILAFFAEQFVSRSVVKRYMAVVHGRTDGSPVNREWGIWNWSLATAAGGRRDTVGRGRTRPCGTRWRTLDHSTHFSLIECDLLTGRKHQIRRHAKLAGHPVVGDRRYGSTRSLAYLARVFSFSRLGLHAHALTVRLPDECRSTTFQSGGLPLAMSQLLDADR